MKVLMLAGRMSMGFGVSVVIAELSKQLAKLDVEVTVGTMDFDSFYTDDCHILKMDADPYVIGKYIAEHNIDCVIAHTTPYFELLSQINEEVIKWVWEHGDPTPSLFPHDEVERANIAANKLIYVYPNVDRVIAISKFIRQDIQWPAADVIPNGCDHVAIRAPRLNSNKQLKIGMLMRLGKGERFYKGGDLFIQLATKLKDSEGMCFSVMGRGKEADAEDFEKAGIKIYLNASNEERDAYLEELDIFLSLSLWEGFNLPLVEAQMSGKLGIALDTGAHPEVTPFIATSIDEIVTFLETLDRDRELLLQYSQKAHRYCVNKYSWSACCRMAEELLLTDCELIS